jgi:hypothetical protein
MIFWMLSIAISVALLVIAAATKEMAPSMAYAHMAIAALMSIIFALVAIRDGRQLAESGASRSAVAASLARYMSYIWAWGALGILITYATGVASWHEWWHFFLAFAVVGAAAMFFANLLQRDAEAGKDDETILKISRNLGYVQLFGMIAVIVGLLIDGKMTRFLTPEYGDWAANNIFFFGALALAAISAFGIKLSAPPAKTG